MTIHCNQCKTALDPDSTSWTWAGGRWVHELVTGAAFLGPGCIVDFCGIGVEEIDMNRIFDEFPEQVKCPICGTSNSGKCTLIPIGGTQEDGIAEAKPVHIDCLDLGNKSNRLVIHGDLLVYRMDGSKS